MGLTTIHSVGELDEDGVLLHDALDAATTNADDTLVVRLRDMERDLGRKLLLKERETLENRPVAASNVDEEVVLVEGLELDLDVGGLHDLVDLAVPLPADEFAVLIRELNLEANLVVEGLRCDKHTCITS